MLTSLLFALNAAPALAAGGGITVVPEYRRTGKETDAVAETAAAEELRSHNECLQALVAAGERMAEPGSPLALAGQEAVDQLGKGKPVAQRLLIRASYGSINLQFEVNDGARRLLRESVELSNVPASFSERLGRKECEIPEKKGTALVDLVLEPIRLKRCKKLRDELISTAAKVAAFLHDYVPENWLNAAKEKVGSSEPGELMPRNLDSYRGGSGKFEQCEARLKRLKADARHTSSVLEEAGSQKPELGLPRKSLDRLEELIKAPGPR